MKEFEKNNKWSHISVLTRTTILSALFCVLYEANNYVKFYFPFGIFAVLLVC